MLLQKDYSTVFGVKESIIPLAIYLYLHIYLIYDTGTEFSRLDITEPCVSNMIFIQLLFDYFFHIHTRNPQTSVWLLHGSRLRSPDRPQVQKEA